MVQHFQDLSSEAWCLEGVDKLRNHSLVVHLDTDFLIEGEIEQSPQGNLQEQLVIAGDKPVELRNDPLLLHFVLVLSEYAQLLEEVEYDEQQVWVIPLQHRHQEGDDLPVLHLPLDLEILRQIQEQVESHK